ncbi:hypothetical protein DSO57_1016771 [Entomophthora muscae]|uniref:Uncharacterized protein n=1 Tax=Entomophthora muscae TaxID=34485 RepID=A0ACC2T4S0_9FUNG|nr:hypothetical protein DSO57_1016771 [Entomophthora muscae]
MGLHKVDLFVSELSSIEKNIHTLSVMNVISILVLKTWEFNPVSQKKPCDEQGRQEPARLPVGPNPGPSEMSFPNQEKQEHASLLSVKTNQTPPSKGYLSHLGGWEPANLLSYRPKLSNYSENHKTLKDDSPNRHQIADNLVPPKTQTYAEVIACLKEVTTKPLPVLPMITSYFHPQVQNG